MAMRMVHLERDGTSVVVDVSGGVPEIVHWGAVLDSPNAETLEVMTQRPLTHGSLDVVPAQLRVRVTIRPRYACRGCGDGVHQRPAPDHAIPA